jgi:hypothetical protein
MSRKNCAPLIFSCRRPMWSLRCVIFSVRSHWRDIFLRVGYVQDFLSARFWIPLGRLTYSTYLVHCVLINVMYFGYRSGLLFSTQWWVSKQKFHNCLVVDLGRLLWCARGGVLREQANILHMLTPYCHESARSTSVGTIYRYIDNKIYFNKY